MGILRNLAKLFNEPAELSCIEWHSVAAGELPVEPERGRMEVEYIAVVEGDSKSMALRYMGNGRWANTSGGFYCGYRVTRWAEFPEV